jgi:hypothetical protein
VGGLAGLPEVKLALRAAAPARQLIFAADGVGDGRVDRVTLLQGLARIAADPPGQLSGAEMIVTVLHG